MSKKSLLSLMGIVFFCSVVPARSQVELPEGNGKKTIQTYCVQCHELSTVTRAGYSEDGWLNNIHMMINVGATVPQDQINPMAQYLAKNLPERPKPEAVIIPGSAKITIKEWVVPTPGSRPHDPLATANGAIWYTGQFANTLGRLDPKTGAFKEYRIPLKAGPHGLAADKDGNIWYTGNFNWHVGKLNPKTGELTAYFMAHYEITALRYGGESQNIPFIVWFGTNKIASIDPDTMDIREYVLPNAETRPRRIAITSDDVLWYSDYSRGYLGRFDPATGKASEWPSPGGPRSQPYGIHAINDVIWYSEAGVKPNTIVGFDPKTERFQTWAIPSGGGVVRNVDVTRDGNLALACSGVNRVGLVEIK